MASRKPRVYVRSIGASKGRFLGMGHTTAWAKGTGTWRGFFFFFFFYKKKIIWVCVLFFFLSILFSTTKASVLVWFL
jgi:hypothetical protein